MWIFSASTYHIIYQTRIQVAEYIEVSILPVPEVVRADLQGWDVKLAVSEKLCHLCDVRKRL